jgi:membrane protease YdiL (CAAX protease family)
MSTLLFIDTSRLLDGLSLAHTPELERVAHGAAIGGVLVGAVLGTLLRSVWYALVACIAVGVWQRLRPSAPLLGADLVARARPLAGALAVGVLAGLVSAWLFHLLRVDSGQALRLLEGYFPRLAAADPGLRSLVALPLALTAALCEELVFRGALLGSLLWWGRKQRWVGPAAAVLTSLAWASLHLSLTDQPLIKLVQIFLLGLGLVALTRRWGLEAAILAHLGLNVAGLVGMWALGP